MEIPGEGALSVRAGLLVDGSEALAYLHRDVQHAAAARPHIILLDLNLPVKSGREVLRAVKADQELPCTRLLS